MDKKIPFFIAFGINGLIFFLLHMNTSKQGFPPPARDIRRNSKIAFNNPDELTHKGEATLANEMAKQIRVACWIMTMPENHDKKAKHVKATWGRRCNVLVFISSEADPNLPTINLGGTEGRGNLWSKTKKAFAYMYEHYKDEADWFLKADDDTYTVVENLRYMLQPYDNTKPIYFASKFKYGGISQGYMSGSAGYVLSKEALRRFVKQGLTDETGLMCRLDGGGAEDVELGKCMENLNVQAGDSQDSMGCRHFFPYVPEQHLFPVQNMDFWYWNNLYYYPEEGGMACCSDSAFLFHYVPPKQMYVIEYLLYHLRLYSIHSRVHFNGLDYASSTKNPSLLFPSSNPATTPHQATSSSPRSRNSKIALQSSDELTHKGDATLANEMAKHIRIACWIMTMPENHDKKAKHVKATWGRRCDVLVFMSSEADPNLPTINLGGTEGRGNLWSKTKKAFAYMYEHFKDEADWFLKADDDTYTVIENLRYMLQPYNTTKPIYFGCKFKYPWFLNLQGQGYMSGGAGYVLSKESLRRLVKQGLTDETGLMCRLDGGGFEDVELGKCMENLNVQAGDSRDSKGRGRFFPFVPEQQIFPVQKNSWYWKYIYYPAEEGMACCSDSAVSFHYVPPNQMYVIEYLLYHLRPYGFHSMVHSNGLDYASSTKKNLHYCLPHQILPQPSHQATSSSPSKLNFVPVLLSSWNFGDKYGK